jgi:hypothetical protein
MVKDKKKVIRLGNCSLLKLSEMAINSRNMQF